jgi:hypothetical protein
MLQAADCAADEKPDMINAWSARMLVTVADRPVPIKLLRFLHAARRHHLATAHLDLAMADTNGIGRLPLARSLDNHRSMHKENSAWVR